MSTMNPRVTSLAPQFLVDDLERSIAYYQKIGFTFGEPWEGFYAIIKPITATEWGTKGFYVEDPDGYIIGFGGRPAAG